MTRRVLAGLLIGAASAILVLLADAWFVVFGDRTVLHPLDALELKTYDWRLTRTAHPETARQDIVLIEIDEYSLQNLEAVAGRWPWPRIVHGSLVDYLSRAPAKLIAYDVSFGAADTRLGFKMGDDTLSGAESDEAFAAAVKKAGNVLLLADATYTGEKSDAPAPPDVGFRLNSPDILERTTILLPYPELAAAAAGFGHNYLSLDADGPVRHTVPFVRSNGVAMSSLGMAAAFKAEVISR